MSDTASHILHFGEAAEILHHAKPLLSQDNKNNPFTSFELYLNELDVLTSSRQQPNLNNKLLAIVRMVDKIDQAIDGQKIHPYTYFSHAYLKNTTATPTKVDCKTISALTQSFNDTKDCLARLDIDPKSLTRIQINKPSAMRTFTSVITNPVHACWQVIRTQQVLNSKHYSLDY